MSGGSFNYAYLRVDSDEVFGALSDISDIATYLYQNDRVLAGDLVSNFVNMAYEYRNKVTELGEKLKDLLQAVEWEKSGDWTWVSVDRSIAELTKGSIEYNERQRAEIKSRMGNLQTMYDETMKTLEAQLQEIEKEMK